MRDQAMIEMGEIRERYHAEPFEPFVLHLDDGRKVAVHDRDLIALSPTGRSVFVSQTDGTCDLVRLKRVKQLSSTSVHASA